MEKTVLFRDFEERDIDFIYRCKTDAKLQSMVVNPPKDFTYEDAVKWVHGCMGEHDTFKFWAICTNDVEKRIVGWVSISNIDYENHSVCHHGIVIGDKEYKDGRAYRETGFFIENYVFNHLRMHKITGSCLYNHVMSRAGMESGGWHLDGIERDAFFKDGKYCSVCHYSMLEDEYKSYIPCANDVEYAKRIVAAAKKIKKEIKNYEY